MTETIKNFIAQHWDNCIRQNKEGNETLIGVPYPFVVPSEVTFDELYYWDTYFTNKGLLLDGRADLAKNNTDNILYIVDKFGFMPNANRFCFLRQSQPPFLSKMVRDVYHYYGDPVWLRSAYDVLKKEYHFWMTYRISEIGLNHYDAGNTPHYTEPIEQNGEFDIYKEMQRRIHFIPDIPEGQMKRHYLACCESGWDINPRWEFCAYDYVSVDLNSILYALEDNMAFFATELQNGEDSLWQTRAKERKKKMLRYLVDENGLFMDYNPKTKQHSKIFSVASLYPFYVGLAERENLQPMLENFGRLEAEYGVLACEKNNAEGNYQWNYPNSWAPLQSIVFTAFEKYGCTELAIRVAEKYMNLVEKVFEKNGCLMEKYNAIDPYASPNTERGDGTTPSMLGWSAGTYLEAEDLLKRLKK